MLSLSLFRMTLCDISVCDLFPVLPVHSHNSLQVCLHQVANRKLDLVVMQVTWDKDGITLAIYEGNSKSVRTFIFSRGTVRAGGVIIGRV